MTLIAKQVVNGKYWIVEKDDGTKIATIQKNPSGVTFVNDHERERFPSVKHLNAKYNIHFESAPDNNSATKEQTVYGFPCECTPFNPLWNVTHRVPVFNKEKKSKTAYCAGHYLVEFHPGVLANTFCPKLISIQRYKHYGPFLTAADSESFRNTLRLANSVKLQDK